MNEIDKTVEVLGRAIAASIEEMASPEVHGFALFISDANHKMHYASNLNRADVVAALKRILPELEASLNCTS